MLLLCLSISRILYKIASQISGYKHYILGMSGNPDSKPLDGGRQEPYERSSDSGNINISRSRQLE